MRKKPFLRLLFFCLTCCSKALMTWCQNAVMSPVWMPWNPNALMTVSSSNKVLPNRDVMMWWSVVVKLQCPVVELQVYTFVMITRNSSNIILSCLYGIIPLYHFAILPSYIDSEAIRKDKGPQAGWTRNAIKDKSFQKWDREVDNWVFVYGRDLLKAA